MSCRLPGESNPNAHFSQQDVRKIRILWGTGLLTCEQIARTYRCSERTIYGIVRGQTYTEEGFKRVDNKSRLTKKGERHSQAKLTEAQVREIRRLLAEGASRATVAAQFGLSAGYVGAIQRRINWCHVR